MDGFDVFLCHNSQDKAAVREIDEVPRQQFELRTFMDESALVGGEEWESRIDAALAASRACAVLVGGRGWGRYQLDGELGPALARRARDAPR